MKTYEATYIISSQITQEKADGVKKELESFIQSKEGVILTSEKISIQTLAYPIKKQSSGYFTTLTFQILEDKIKEIKEKIEKNSEILRHLILIKKPFKELKRARTRKPSATSRFKVAEESPFIKNSENKKKTETVKIDEIEKKLDEILSE